MRVAPSAAGAAPPQAQPQGKPQGPGPAEFIQMIEQGFMGLGKVIQQAGDQLPPDDIKLFQAAAQATDNMIQSLTGAEESQEQQAPSKPAPGGPMPANAAPGSQTPG